MANNTISSLQLEKLLEVNSKSIELNTVVHSRFEDITEKLDSFKNGQKEIKIEAKESYKDITEKLEEQKRTTDEIDRKLFKLNIILGSNVFALIVGLIVLIIKIFIGVP